VRLVHSSCVLLNERTLNPSANGSVAQIFRSETHVLGSGAGADMRPGILGSGIADQFNHRLLQ